jgi:hypothetical protein
MIASIRNAGHMVPADQPRAMFDLLKRFIELNEPTGCGRINGPFSTLIITFLSFILFYLI